MLLRFGMSKFPSGDIVSQRLLCRESGHCSDGVEVPTDSFSRDGSASSSRHCLLTEQPQERIEAVNRQSSGVLEKNGKHGSFLDKAPHAPK
jgi:hypothetical protein